MKITCGQSAFYYSLGLIQDCYRVSSKQSIIYFSYNITVNLLEQRNKALSHTYGNKVYLESSFGTTGGLLFRGNSYHLLVVDGKVSDSPQVKVTYESTSWYSFFRGISIPSVLSSRVSPIFLPQNEVVKCIMTLVSFGPQIAGYGFLQTVAHGGLAWRNP